jgi:hypothetical protein
MSDEQQREPVVLRGSLIVQDVRGSIIGGNDLAQPTVIIAVRSFCQRWGFLL